MNYLTAPGLIHTVFTPEEICFAVAIKFSKRVCTTKNFIDRSNSGNFKEDFGIEEVCSKARFRPYVEARRVFSYLMSKYLNRPLVSICSEIGLDHTSVHYHIKSVSAFIDTDNHYKSELESSITELKSMLSFYYSL
jgi:hypothetical protein